MKNKRITPRSIYWKNVSVKNFNKTIAQCEYSIFFYCKESDPKCDDHVKKYDKLRFIHRHCRWYYINWDEAMRDDKSLSNEDYTKIRMYHHRKCIIDKEKKTVKELNDYILENTLSSLILKKQIKNYPKANLPCAKATTDVASGTLSSSSLTLGTSSQSLLLPSHPSVEHRKTATVQHQQGYRTPDVRRKTSSPQRSIPTIVSYPSPAATITHRPNKRKTRKPIRVTSEIYHSYTQNLPMLPHMTNQTSIRSSKPLDLPTHSRRRHESDSSSRDILTQSVQSRATPYIVPQRTHTATSITTSNTLSSPTRSSVIKNISVTQSRDLSSYIPRLPPPYPSQK